MRQFLLFTCQLISVLASLAPPTNLSMTSVNLHHVLHWDPGPQTPPGTTFQVFRSNNRKPWKLLGNTTSSSLKVRLGTHVKNILSVRAVYGGLTSNRSANYSFFPLQQTVIGPTVVALSGCGDCLLVNVSLPLPARGSGVLDFFSLYGFTLKAQWKKQGGEEHESEVEGPQFLLPNLEKGAEYCVKVTIHTPINPYMKPSSWSCSYTSILPPSPVPVILGVAMFLLVVVFCVVTGVLIGLNYSGYLCKLKAALPSALQEALNSGYSLTPESPALDPVYISTDPHSSNHTSPPVAAQAGEEEEEEEEEEEGLQEYLDRGAEPPPADTSHPHSAPENYGRSKAASDCEGGLTDGGDGEEEIEVKELGRPPTPSDEDHETIEEVVEGSGNINLLSITLSALTDQGEEQDEEEEEEKEEEEQGVEQDSSYLLDHTHTLMDAAVTHLNQTQTLTCGEGDGVEGFDGYMRHL